ncbi:DUF6113 family protein [Salinibacterium sp. ZJ450]|uniref:DUF6113 family protein n=1 Tax=Salinibacterium sp. ZJ450 TaxID=2708338 RepID=UPI00141FC231|nr:DUF6113 family protein [Salinibacterium sp. ZJ450]
MAQRILFVFAHPDDESISAGGTIATLVDAGNEVTVLTLTRGERGEVIPAELRHLEGSPDLAATREAELAEAMRALGVTDHRFLGDAQARWRGLPPRRYEDSGMRWGEHGAEPAAEISPTSLSAAPFTEVTADVAAVLSDIRADLVISENENGGYGHPDHIIAHRAARLAAEVAGVRFLVAEPVGNGMPDDVPADVVPADGDPADGVLAAEPVRDAIPAHAIPAHTIAIDVTAVLDRKRAALAAHRTQLIVDDDGFTLSNGERFPISRTEHFRQILAGGSTGNTTAAAPTRTRRWPGLLAASVAALIGGAVIGALGTAVHQAMPPLGISLSLVMVAAVLAGLRAVADSRVVATAGALGVLGAVALLATSGAGGSVLIPATIEGYLWTFGPAVIAFFVLAWPRLRATPGVSRMEDVPRVKDRATP